MLEITPEMLEDPKKAMYFDMIRPDGSKMMTNRYTGPHEIITDLTKEDQVYIIQQPLSIQRKILEELYKKYGSSLMKQKQLFDEGLVKMPFVGMPDTSSEQRRVDTPNTPHSRPANDNSPAYYAPGSPAYYAPGSPEYASASPAYNPNETSPLPSVGSPYNPNETSPLPSVALPSVASPYNPSTPEQTNILEVEQPPIVIEPAPASTDVIKTITL